MNIRSVDNGQMANETAQKQQSPQISLAYSRKNNSVYEMINRFAT